MTFKTIEELEEEKTEVSLPELMERLGHKLCNVMQVAKSHEITVKTLYRCIKPYIKRCPGRTSLNIYLGIMSLSNAIANSKP